MPMTTRAAIQTASGLPLIIDELELPDPRPDQAGSFTGQDVNTPGGYVMW